MTMPDHVYRIIQVAGSSERSIEDAIETAVARASRTLRQVGWFEVVETRGHVEDGKVAHYQDNLKIGFTLEDDDLPHWPLLRASAHHSFSVPRTAVSASTQSSTERRQFAAVRKPRCVTVPTG